MTLCGPLPSRLDLAIPCFFFSLCKIFFVPSLYSSRAGMMQPWACSAGRDVRAAALSGWRVFTRCLCRHNHFWCDPFYAFGKKKPAATAHTPEVGEMEMGFSNFLCLRLLRGSLTIRAHRTPSSPSLCGGRFAHYLVCASLRKEAVIVAAPCHKSTKTFGGKESVRAALMSLYSPPSAYFSLLLALSPASALCPPGARRARAWLEPLLCYRNAPFLKKKLGVFLVSLAGWRGTQNHPPRSWCSCSCLSPQSCVSAVGLTADARSAKSRGGFWTGKRNPVRLSVTAAYTRNRTGATPNHITLGHAWLFLLKTEWPQTRYNIFNREAFLRSALSCLFLPGRCFNDCGVTHCVPKAGERQWISFISRLGRAVIFQRSMYSEAKAPALPKRGTLLSCL